VVRRSPDGHAALRPARRAARLGESAFADTTHGLYTHTKSRAEGFWNVNLADPAHLPAPETSGTPFFTYATAYAARTASVTAGQYRPIVASAWNSLVTTAVHPDGSLGYAQGVGDRPESSQPGDLRRPAASGRASSYITGPGW
jgi:rhamnogalacturonyl hydrolase YesR